MKALKSIKIERQISMEEKRIHKTSVGGQALIVGVMMLSNLKSVDWEDLSEAIPAFFTSIFMGFSYSITYGIAAGFLTYTLVKVVKGQAKDVHFIMWILDILFILNFISMAVF